jgi:anthranilate phosphoribosyltransferase
VSSRSGSADVLEALGVNIGLDLKDVKDCIEKIGIGFMFAPNFHKSMKHAAGVRKDLTIRTIFNILGPLTNPANAKGQVLGVFDEKLTEVMANVLKNLGIEKAMILCGRDGMDEITVCNSTKISELCDGEMKNYEITPEQFGFKRRLLEEIVGGDSKINSAIILDIFKGEKGAKRDIVLLNSAAALYVGKVVRSLADGVFMAEEIIASGKAMKKLDELRGFSGGQK